MRSFRQIAFVVLVVLVVAAFGVFAVQNYDPIAVRFLSYASRPMPVFVFLIGFFMMGVLLAGVFALSEIFRLNNKCRRLNRQVTALEKQLIVMKQQPLLDDFQPHRSTSEGDSNGEEKSDLLDEQGFLKRTMLFL